MSTPIRGKVLPNSIVLNTITKSINLGKAIKEAKDRCRDLVEAAAKSLDAYLLFKGKVIHFER